MTSCPWWLSCNWILLSGYFILDLFICSSFGLNPASTHLPWSELALPAWRHSWGFLIWCWLTLYLWNRQTLLSSKQPLCVCVCVLFPTWQVTFMMLVSTLLSGLPDLLLCLLNYIIWYLGVQWKFVVTLQNLYWKMKHTNKEVLGSCEAAQNA